MKIKLNEIIDPAEGRITVETDCQGRKHARFDLRGLPRVETLLVGKPVSKAVHMAEHLCGICPVAHHLAGMRALDSLTERTPIDSKADLVRRLLHYGSLVEAHSLRLATANREAGISLRKFSKQMLTAAGLTGHFPNIAIPGGVRCVLKREHLQVVERGINDALADAWRVASWLQREENKRQLGVAQIDMADVALVNQAGEPDVFGTKVRVARKGKVIEEFGFEEWPEKIAEEIPGSPAPRPYIVTLGPENGHYRVGPVAQLSVGELPTPRAAQLQAKWWDSSHNADAARAIMTVHVLEKTGKIISQLVNSSDDLLVASPPEPTEWNPGIATGLVDGPRGILAHTYRIDATGVISEAVILTPTAQNETWLAALLTAATELLNETQREEVMESSIREADPCLPISLAPEGQMGLKLDMINRE